MSPKAILCVDDEPIILNSLKAQLKDYFGKHYLYEYAESAEEAWEVIEELHGNGVKILVIVSDWLMPRIKGDEFLIQVHQKFPDIIKVMLRLLKPLNEPVNRRICIGVSINRGMPAN
jgi:CheY-like chemotaxis protein